MLILLLFIAVTTATTRHYESVFSTSAYGKILRNDYNGIHQIEVDDLFTTLFVLLATVIFVTYYIEFMFKFTNPNVNEYIDLTIITTGTGRSETNDETGTNDDEDSAETFKEIKRPSLLHIKLPSEANYTNGYIDFIAETVMDIYGLHTENWYSAPSAVYYNYHGDIYVIFAKNGDIPWAENPKIETGQGLAELLQDFNCNVQQLETEIYNFKDDKQLAKRLSMLIAMTMKTTIQQLYHDEISNENGPESLETIVDELEARDISWATTPLGELHGRWLKVAECSTGIGYRIHNYTGVPYNSYLTPESTQKFIDFVATTDSPSYVYGDILSELDGMFDDLLEVSSKVGSETDDETDYADDNDSMPELMSESTSETSEVAEIQLTPTAEDTKTLIIE